MVNSGDVAKGICGVGEKFGFTKAFSEDGKCLCIKFDFISHRLCWAHVMFFPGIQFSILNELTFQVMWLQMTRHPLHLYVGVAA